MPSTITEDQDYAAYDAMPDMYDILPATYNVPPPNKGISNIIAPFTVSSTDVLKI